MNTPNVQSARQPSETARAEAAAWIARLHGPQRSPELEAGLRRWLAESSDNAFAFERMTEAWEAATAVSTGHFPRVRVHERGFDRRVFARAAVLLVCCGIFGLATYGWWRDPGYVTDIGEQRSVRLADGSRVTLNSASRVVVDYSESQRRVRLERGEAFFEVAHNPQRPFVVVAGSREVTALGTAFSVRYEADRFAVTLVEGKVAVAPTAPASGSSNPEAAGTGSANNAEDSDADVITLAPGQRLVLASMSAPRLDMPRIDAVTAWRRGEVVLDRTLLADAIAEMNRYDETRLVLDDARVAGLRVSGIYRAGDNAGFARAVAKVYDITVTEERGRIHLSEAAEGASP